MYYGEQVETNRVIYTPSNFARSSLLYLQEVGELKALKPHTSKRENLASYLFFIVRSGSGELTYNQAIYPLTVGDCVFIDCQMSYTHTTSTDLWSLSWFHFNGAMMPNIYEKYLERGGLPVFHPASDFFPLWGNLYAIASGQDYIRDMKINETLASFLSMLMVESWHPENRGTKKTDLDEIRLYLEQHFRERIVLDDLAGKFFINKYYLTRIFKEKYGTSISSYLMTLRINHAKNELRFSKKSIEDIGLECGMNELYYFSRMFKKVEGISPSEYRKKW